MANFGRVKTWGNETLQAADLNAEFDNIINNVTSGSVSSANIDLTDGYAWTGAHTFSVDLKVLNGAGVIVGNTAQVTTSSAGEFQVLGTAAADSTAIIGHWAAAATGGKLSFVKSRNATIGSSTIVSDNDVLGTIEFMADDGSDFATPAASIFSRVNGTPGANDMPGELVLAVTADAGNAVTERVRILQNGTVELNSATLSFDAAASIDTSGNNNLGISAGTADVQVTASNLTPASNDGSALGVSGTAWSDLFLASGSAVNWVAGDITLTHSAGKLTFGGDGAVEIDFNNHEITNVDIDSGAIDGTVIGAASAAAGSFAAIVGTSLDINGAADISGDLTLSAGADGALTFANAGENSIKIPDNQASALIIEEADAAYLTFVTTNSGEKITLGKKLEAGSVEIEGSAFDVNGGNIDGTVIGAASAAAGTFTTITGSDDASITSADNLSPIFLVENTHANANSASIDFYKNSSSVATYDGLGTINFYGKNAAGTPEKTKYAYISSAGAVITDGSESGQLDFGILNGVSSTSVIRVEPTEVVFNDNQVDMDFRVESDDNANAFFVQGSDGKVGIGTGAPSQVIESKSSGQSTWYNSTTGAADAEIQFGVDVDDSANDYYARVGIDYSHAKALKLNASGSLSDNHLTVGQGGNVGVGTSTWGTNSVNVLAIANGTIPASNIANQVQLYAEDDSSSSELKVRDEAGNITTLSPHNFGNEAPSEEMAWAYHSSRNNKSIWVDMLRVVRLLEKLTGENLVRIEER